MEYIKKYLNYAAYALLFLALLAFNIWPYKKTFPLVLAILGFLSLAVYIALNLSKLKKTFTRKSFLYSSNLALIIILVLGIVVIVNFFFAKHHHRFDFTESKLHSLADQSISVLKNLDKEIQIKGFFLEGNYEKAKMENLLQIYSYHSSKIKVEFIDPDKNPGLVKRYEITQDGTTILEYEGKESRITSTAEEDITNAIIKLTRGGEKIIYFLEGHGEGSLEDIEDAGYSQAKNEMEKIGYKVQKLSLALQGTFPDDAALLVIPGPVKDLIPEELDTIQSYLSRGGRVFLMIDPESASGIDSFLLDFGIQLENDLIIDTVSRLMGGDYFMPVVSEYEFHDITRKFRYATFFPYARSVEPAEEKPDGIFVQSIAKSSANSWSERQLDHQKVTFDEESDKAGPVSLACVVTIDNRETGAGDPESEGAESSGFENSNRREGRLAVFGDSDFFSNQYYNLSGNGNLFLNTANWLTEEEDLISIQPKTTTPRTIHLSPSQGKMIFFVSLIILPLAVLITGITVWLRRRKL